MSSSNKFNVLANRMSNLNWIEMTFEGEGEGCRNISFCDLLPNFFYEEFIVMRQCLTASDKVTEVLELKILLLLKKDCV